MIAIVAVDEKWGIGRNNSLLFSVPEDMKFFRQTTTGKTIIVGRKTLESFPSSKPLKNRVNIVLSSSMSFEGAVCVKNLTELFEEIKKYNRDEVFVCGGASVYKMLLPYCDKAFVTKIHADGNADTFFPNLDADSNWSLAKVRKEKSGELNVDFCTYENRNVEKLG